MRVLFVEDEPRISADIEAALAAGGYHCDIAVDGEDAWFRGDTESYDLIVLDLGPDVIETRRGFGYVVATEEPA